MVDVGEVHLVSGEGAGGCVRRTGVARRRIVCVSDVHGEGPVPPHAAPGELDAARSAHLREIVPGSRALQSWSRAIAAVRASRVAHVWAGEGLQDQCFVTVLLHLIRRHAPDAADRFVLHQPDPPSGAVGITAPEALARWPVTPCTPVIVDRYLHGADALLSDTPDPLLGSLRSGTTGSPLLAAFRSLLRRYPGADTGLPEWDARLLRTVAALGGEGGAGRVVGQTLVLGGDDGDLIGDAWLWHRAKRLADPRRGPPLLEITGRRQAGFREVHVRLTTAGEAVLGGAVDAIALRGIDDQVVNVRLTPGRCWVREGEELALRLGPS